MIPKTIHYCWLSGDAFPDKIIYCINSWKKILKDYNFILWDLKKIDINSSLWVKRAFENKKYAFAADYIRLYALYYCGGIYLDSDVELLKPLDALLKLPYFFGKENSHSEIEPAIMGAEKGTEWVKKCLDYYDSRSFITETGKFDTRTLPNIMSEIIRENYIIHDIFSIEEFGNNENLLYRFPVDFFSPIDWKTNKQEITLNTYSIHHFRGSWLPPLKKLRLKIRHFFHLSDSSIMIRIYKSIISTPKKH
jgi:mannosyltransferase OCH1-like enzyme